MTQRNPFIVACPDCRAAAGQRCRISNPKLALDGHGVHGGRVDAVRLRLVTHGTCKLCGQTMYQATEPDDTWHPTSGPFAVSVTCPPEPARDDLKGWQEFFAKGWQPGRPGAVHFVPDAVQPAPPPEQPNPPPPTQYAVLPPPPHSDPMQDPPGSAV